MTFIKTINLTAWINKKYETNLFKKSSLKNIFNMKKFLLLLVMGTLVYSLSAQDVIYTLTGKINDQPTSIDSILVVNKTNNTRLMFKDLPDLPNYNINLTQKAFWGATGIKKFGTNQGFLVKRNAPGMLVLGCNENKPVPTSLTVFNASGQKIYGFNNRKLTKGQALNIHLGQPGLFIIKIMSPLGVQAFIVIGAQQQRSKPVFVNVTGQAALVHSNFKVTTAISDKGFNFTPGDSIQFTVYKSAYYAPPATVKASGSDTLFFTFSRAKPNAVFTTKPTSGNAPLTVKFTDQSANNPISWKWDFGDNTTSTEQNPSHTYQNAGKYTVKLTVTNDQGSDTKTKTDYITVSSGSGCNNSIDVKWVYVNGGTFQMGRNNGNNNEKPVHTVTLNSFKISKYEITTGQYSKFLNSIGCNSDGKYNDLRYGNVYYFYRKSGKKDYPVTYVTWYGAQAYAKWAGGRLPTEAEWEFAARGGNKSKGYKFSGGDTIDNVAWYWDNSDSAGSLNLDYFHGIFPVGEKAPNELGIYDMSGNVREWCNDWWGRYNNEPQSNPQGPSSGSERVLRGGDWHSNSGSCRIDFRDRSKPLESGNQYGFRIAVDVTQFSAIPVSGSAPLKVIFTDHSTGNPNSWKWDFGDGNTSSVQNPSHTYTSPGNYTVKLTTTNNQDIDTKTKEGYITVYNGGYANLNWVKVEGGTFQMGGVWKPAHTVTLSSFKITKYEITNSQFCKFLNDIKCSSDGKFNDADYGIVYYLDPEYYVYNNIKYNNGQFVTHSANLPTTQVTWYGAHAFAKWAGGRLPTAAEWEYAARGGNKSKGYEYSGSDTIGNVAWYKGNTGWIHPIGTKAPNELGIYDMSGNVGEWCNDWCGSYNNSPQYNPQGPSNGSKRVMSGGSFYDVELDCLPQSYECYAPTVSAGSLGFRIASDVTQLSTDFLANLISGTAPLTVTFTDYSAGKPTSWKWDFGDGNTSTLQNPVHTYATSGSYTVKLTTANKKTSNSKTKADYISINNSNGGSSDLEWVNVSGGFFQMGSNDTYDDDYVHNVSLSSFKITKYEITNSQFCKFLNSIGYNSRYYDPDYGDVRYIDIADSNCQIIYNNGKFVVKSGLADYPVIEVTWYGAHAFAKWAGGKLPTEAEWEFAARGGNKSKGYEYSGSDNFDNVGWDWFNSDAKGHSNLESGRGTFPVGEKAPNELGIYDMSGNVWEWCQDWYNANYYRNSPVNDPQGPLGGIYRVLRGESWYTKRHPVTFRAPRRPYEATSNYGFRVAVDTTQLSANFSTIPASGTAPLRVSFIDHSNGNPASWNWDFGDGNLSVKQSPTHTYTIPGTYTVKLTATSYQGSITKTGVITVKRGNGNGGATGIFTDPRDGKTYKTVKIGDQIWMAKNLAYKMDNGCWAYYNDENNVATYGRLYTWDAAKKACPSGWHLPSDYEWKKLETFLGTIQSQVDEADKLKSTSGWYSGKNGTDAVSFSALPGGCRNTNGSFNHLGKGGYWWVNNRYKTSNTNETRADFCDLYYSLSTVTHGRYGTKHGFSVRCVRADVTSIPTTAFYAVNTTGPAPLTVSFIDNSAGIPTSWQWDFGDDSTSTEQNPSHTYQKAGKYTVKLTVTNNQGSDSETKTDYITVNSGGGPGTFTDPRDGKIYKTVKIGTQTWMAENLAYLPNVSLASNGSKTDSYYYVYGYNGTSVSEAKATDNYTTYGVLYNWAAAKAACPGGWHLPTDEEWKTLEMYLGMSQSQADGTGSRGIDEGRKLKRTSGWYQGGNGSDEVGFSALPGGYRSNYGNFNNLSYFGYWWSATSTCYRSLYYGSVKVNRFYDDKDKGWSVRCVRDTDNGK